MSFEFSRQKAIEDFRRARLEASLEAIASRLTGKSIALLSYKEVANKLKVTGWAGRGLQTIPVNAIVGSVGRYNDFTRTFLPRQETDLNRWTTVRAAAYDVTQLPPIEVYQIGQAYFVLDGNHRVSIARRQGVDFIDAQVTEVRTRVPLLANDRPDALIVKAEYAAFLEATRLDQLRPGADLRVSAPGQYVHLENLIEAHRYFIETAEEREVDDVEAVCGWYDDAYLPLVEAIREQGILRYFPGRTETDFYVWLARHQTLLQNELGWQIRPEVAVSQLSSQVVPQRKSLGQRLAGRLRQAASPIRRWWRIPESKNWSQEKTLDRYSQQLFADILVLMTGGQPIWQQALLFARKEEAQVCGLLLRELANNQVDEDVMRATFNRVCQENGVAGNLAVETGDVVERICERARLTDLVVLGRAFPHSNPAEALPTAVLRAIIQRSPRPMLIVPDHETPLRRVLLAYDGRARAREGLFVAAYLAELWGVALTVATVPEPGQDVTAALTYARRYLDVHEVEATYVTEAGPVGETLWRTAAAHGCDLVVMGGSGNGRNAPGSAVVYLLREWELPLLICP